MCVICCRNSCCESFHSLEEQEKYQKALDAYNKFLEIRAEIRNSEDEENE